MTGLESQASNEGSNCSPNWATTIDLTRYLFFFKKMGQPRPLFRLFSSFQTNQFLQQINVKKCSSSIRRRDSNSQPSDYESPPLTTRPGLPPN